MEVVLGHVTMTLDNVVVVASTSAS